MITIRFGFIGAGKVGFALGKYFKENNLDLVGYYSKNINSSKEAAKFTESKYFLNIKEILEKCDTIIITTPDSLIEEVWNSMKKLCVSEKIICHCSGSLSSKIFSEIEEYNSYGYSIHPMFAFSDKYNSHKKLKEAFITIEGSSEYLNELKSIFEGIGNRVKTISAESKIEYHLASVFVSNNVIALIEIGARLLMECDFTQEEAISALYPLMDNNIKNIRESGIVDSLTGPIERNDVETVKRHLECLDEDLELYKLISKKLIGIAKEKNKNRDYSCLEKMMGD